MDRVSQLSSAIAHEDVAETTPVLASHNALAPPAQSDGKQHLESSPRKPCGTSDNYSYRYNYNYASVSYLAKSRRAFLCVWGP